MGFSRMKTSFLVLLFSLASWTLSVSQTQGTALLGGQTDHSGITVSFVPVSLSGQSNSTTTNSNGDYNLNLVPGVYEVSFSKSGYQNIHYQNGSPQVLNGNDSLNTVNLPMGIFKNVNGVQAGVWDSDTIYIVDADVSVPSGLQLSIEAGTEVLFNGNYEINVSGSLVAEGSGTDGITFSPNPITSTPFWKGFVLNRADSAIFRNCLIDHADLGIQVQGNPSFTANLVVENSVIRHTPSGGISLYSRVDALISENEFYDYGNAGVLIITDFGSTQDIQCNSFHNATGPGVYSFDTRGDLYIGSNIVFDLTGNNAWGLRPRKAGGTTIVENNVIFNVSDGIQETTNGANLSATLIQNNLIYNTDRGMVLTGAGGSIISMNLILDSNVGILQFDPNFGTPSALNYNAFYNLGQNFSDVPIPGLGTVLTVNSQGDSSDAWFNIFENPLLIPQFSLFPDQGSPLFDAGDPTAPLDTNGTTADIGLRYDFISCLNIPQLINGVVTVREETANPSQAIVSLWPNPAKDHFFVSSSAPVKEVKLFGMDGKEIALQLDGQGAYSFSNLSPGLYFVQLQTAKGPQTQRLLVGN